MKKFKITAFFIIMTPILFFTACDSSYDLVFDRHSILGGVQSYEFPDEIIGCYDSEIDDYHICIKKNYVQIGKDTFDFLYVELYLNDTFVLYKHNGFFTLRNLSFEPDECTVLAFFPRNSLKYSLKIFTAPDYSTFVKYTSNIPVVQRGKPEDSLSLTKYFITRPDSIQFRSLVLDDEKFFLKNYRKHVH